MKENPQELVKEAENLIEDKVEKNQFQEFLKNPENKNKAFLLATEIQDLVGKNWVTLNRIAVKTKMVNIHQKIELCRMFGFLDTRMDHLGNTLYKIILTNEDMMSALDSRIEEYKKAIVQLEQERLKYIEP